MNHPQHDFNAFRAKVAGSARPYEKRSDPTIHTIADAIDKIAGAFDQYKAAADQREAQLRAAVERMETKLARPGAPVGQDSSVNETKSLKTADGRVIPLLSSKQKVADFFARGSGEEFSLGEFARDAVVGSRKAASGPALVPTGISSIVIDSVRAQSALVDAGASTIIIDGPTVLARLTTPPTVHQHTEGATDISESDINATPVTLNPKTLVALIPLTSELVSDSPNLDAALNLALAGAFAAKLDALGLATILADNGIAKSGSGQDPAIWLKVLEAVGASLALNMALPAAHISAPADFIARASQLASTAGSWLGKPPALATMRELQTTGLTAGTALLGDFAKAFTFAVRSELRVEVIRWAKSTSATHMFVAHMRADGVVLQPGHLFMQLKTVP